MLEELKEAVCKANLDLVAAGLVIQTWGNASGIDRDAGRVVIKPSGVPYDRMKPQDMVVVDLATGKPVEKPSLRPSSDTPTHLELYRAFEHIGGVAHTHSIYATAWAQARREIPVLGTTHGDYFFGPVPCTRLLKPEEIRTEYEANTGRVIAERFADLDPSTIPGVLVAYHGPVAWGTSPAMAAHNAVVLEHLARLASKTLAVDPKAQPMPRELLEKHFLRKHGPGRYYGQT